MILHVLGVIAELMPLMAALANLEGVVGIKLTSPMLYVPLCVGTGYTMSGNLSSSIMATLLILVMFQLRPRA